MILCIYIYLYIIYIYVYTYIHIDTMYTVSMDTVISKYTHIHNIYNFQEFIKMLLLKLMIIFKGYLH